MSTSYAEQAYGILMDNHEWEYEEVAELMELLDEKLIELSRQEGPIEINLDEGDYGIIEKENCEALID